MTPQAASALFAVALAACGTVTSSPHAVGVGPALGAVLAAADRTRAPWRCSGSRELAPDTALGEWELAAGTVRRIAAGSTRLPIDTPGAVPVRGFPMVTGGRPPGDQGKPTVRDRADVIGIVADAAGSDPRTMASLAQLRTSFERADVDLVVSLGGMGSTQADIAATLGALVGPWPIIALPGDLESMSAHVAAIAELRARGAAVVDGRGVRSIEAQDASLVMIPGVGSPYRSPAGSDSCVWTASDVAQLHRGLSAFPGLRIAVSAEAPRKVVDGEATGEVALFPQVPVDVVVHGPTQAAPTPDTRGERDSAKVALSPGSADATTRLPPSRSPAAGRLAIRERTWEWRAIIDPPPHSRGNAVTLENPREGTHPGDHWKSLTMGRTNDPRVRVRDDPWKSPTGDDARPPAARASRGTREQAEVIEGERRNFAAR